MHDETQQPTTEQEDTLPAPLTSKEITTEKIASLEQYKNLVLSDLTDKAAAKSIDEKRREVKRVRCAAEPICDAEREEAMREDAEQLKLEQSDGKATLYAGIGAGVLLLLGAGFGFMRRKYLKEGVVFQWKIK